jgi:hypothetical protein
MSGHDRTVVSDIALDAALNLTKVETINYCRETTLAELLEWVGLTENDAATMTINDLITLCYDADYGRLGPSFADWIERFSDVDGSVTIWERIK